MPEHFTKAVVEATFWCNKCFKNTPHMVQDGRRGACLICLAKPLPPPPPADPQGSLF